MSISNELSREFAIDEDISRAFVDDMFGLISEQLANGESVKLAGFGTFLVVTTKSRPARNPKTLDPVIIPERRTVKFRISDQLKRKGAAVSDNEE